MSRRTNYRRGRLFCATLAALSSLWVGHALAASAVPAPPPSPNAVALNGVSAHASTLQRANEWLAQGQARTAYRMLAPLEPQLAGNPEYDLLFGQAALGADQPSKAAFAFERCLAVAPTQGLCRLGMARAHIDLQETTSARHELATLSQASPPTPVQEAITRYLGLLSDQEVVSQDSRLTSYLQLGVGYDSNINNATARDSMALPLFGNLVFRLSPEGRKQGSGFAQARFNISYSAPIAPHWRFLTEANIAATGNWQTHRYNTLVSDLNLGVVRSANKHQFIAKLQGQHYQLGNHTYRNMVGVLGQYAYAINPQSEVSLFAQASRLSYPQHRLRNANRYTLGASLMQGLADGRALAYLTAYGGTEKTIHSGAPAHYQHKFIGARAGGMVLLTPRLQLEAGVGAENRRYDGRDLLFQKAHRGTLYDAYLGLNYAINRKLSLRPQYRYMHNDSNIVLHDYQRHVITLNLRYELF